jgi:2-polyprenyl-3-methyl-5-hydroxy-6-metoxy-1,4-benzoquinol methylase
LSTTGHWDEAFSRRRVGGHPVDPWLPRALAHFGDVAGKTVIDVGCGRGGASLFFAEEGAHVIAIDTSDVAIRKLDRYCRNHGIDTIEARVLSAMDIDRLGSHDLVYGSLILHHLEPFDRFARVLRQTIRPGGRGYFWENNAASRTMVWFRQHVVGKLWVPKLGDEEEFPLTPQEVDLLRRHFTVEQGFPELVYFELASAYLAKSKLQQPARRLDQALYRFEALRRYSYRQELKLS